MYALVVAKNGVKMQVSNLSGGGWTMGRGMYKSKGASVDAIAQGLGNIIGRTVENQTGLKGHYDFSLQWTPDAIPAGPDEKQSEAFGPTLFTAIQEQMGLKLEPKK